MKRKQLEKLYTKEQLDIHYENIRRINYKNKLRTEELKEKYKTEFEKAKKHFKKVKFSLVWDWLWLNNNWWRLFVSFNELDYYINLQKMKNTI